MAATKRRNTIVAGVAVAALLAGVVVATRSSDPLIVLSYSPTTTTALPAPADPPPLPEVTTPPPEPVPTRGGGGGGGSGPAVALKPANGRPFAPPIPFTSSIPVPEGLVFVLVLGSDARPREDLLRSRADSIHLVAVNTATGQGTVVGFPRDSYVTYPNGRRGKINDAMTQGGPRLMAETVRHVTGLPVHFWAVTGFVGLARMVDELGGVDVFVETRMNDRLSGARFQPGWHHFTGAEALAFSRNRHTDDGDFARSKHQGDVILAALAKMRSEVADDDGIFHWLAVLGRSVQLDVPADKLPSLAVLARRLDPTRVTNVVVPGRVGWAGSASVVYLTPAAANMFVDLRDDAVLGPTEGATPPPAETTTTTTSTTPTSEPPPSPPPSETTTTTTADVVPTLP